MKRLVMIFVFLTSTAYSSVSVSNDVSVSTSSGAGGVMFSWVVKDDDIFFCVAREFQEGIVSCIKAKETDSN